MTTKDEAKAKIAKIKSELDELQRIVDAPDERVIITKIKHILKSWYGGKLISVEEEIEGGRIIVNVRPSLDLEGTLESIRNLGVNITGIHSKTDELSLYFS